MDCPKCSAELFSFNVDDIELEQCTSCEGIWFDKNELKRIKDKADSDLNWMDYEIWKHTDKFKLNVKKYDCPKCGDKMEVLDYDNTSIEIDYCRSCNGIWFDKGEIENLINILEEELLNKPFNEYVKATLEEARELITGPESFISEWKDFSTIMRFLQYRILSDHPKLAEIFVNIQNNPLNK